MDDLVVARIQLSIYRSRCGLGRLKSDKECGDSSVATLFGHPADGLVAPVLLAANLSQDMSLTKILNKLKRFILEQIYVEK